MAEISDNGMLVHLQTFPIFDTAELEETGMDLLYNAM
jgi:hypothetical protein